MGSTANPNIRMISLHDVIGSSGQPEARARSESKGNQGRQRDLPLAPDLDLEQRRLSIEAHAIPLVNMRTDDVMTSTSLPTENAIGSSGSGTDSERQQPMETAQMASSKPMMGAGQHVLAPPCPMGLGALERKVLDASDEARPEWMVGKDELMAISPAFEPAQYSHGCASCALACFMKNSPHAALASLTVRRFGVACLRLRLVC
jgi:hypothetical protein